MYELLNLDRKDMEMSIINGDATADSILPILLSGFMRDINAGAIIEEMSDVDDMSLADTEVSGSLYTPSNASIESGCNNWL